MKQYVSANMNTYDDHGAYDDNNVEQRGVVRKSANEKPARFLRFLTNNLLHHTWLPGLSACLLSAVAKSTKG